MTKMEIINAIVGTFNELCNANNISYTAGNLMVNALNYQITATHVIIYVDTKAAPYVLNTNKSGLSEKPKGNNVPNEGWWEIFCKEFAHRLANKLRGEIK